MRPLAHCIDHVVVPTEDPADLFGALSGTVGIPAAWPLLSVGMFESAGITFGNGGLEILRNLDGGPPFFDSRLPAVVRSIAFKPAAPMREIAAALDERGVEHTGVVAFGTRKDGSPVGEAIICTGVSKESFVASFVEFPGAPLLCGEPSRELLATSGGGSIGVVGFEEIQVGAPDPAEAAEAWQAILDPLPPVEEGCWAPGDGPRLRIKESPIEGVAGLVLKVASLERARTALAERRLLGPVRAHGCGIRHPEMHGLDIWLVE